MGRYGRKCARSAGGTRCVIWEVIDMARPICIDPGHGGHDPGAIGPTGLRESEVVLDVANRIVSLLDERGHSVLMTRERDSFVGLRERAKVANHASSRIFVSLHCNAFTDPDANGLERSEERRVGKERRSWRW